MEVTFALIGALFVGVAFGATITFLIMADRLARSKKLIDQFLADQGKMMNYQRQAMEAQDEAKRLIRKHSAPQ